MGERNYTTLAVVLSVKPQGEHNRAVHLLSPERGLFSATLYGGPKSRLRSLVQVFHAGTLSVYANEATRSQKITDFDVSASHDTFRESLFKLWAAHLATELVVKTKCGGDFSGSYRLLTALFDGMDASDEPGSRLGLLRFLWRYQVLLGVQPDVHRCCHCGSPLLDESLSVHKTVLYSTDSNGFTCEDCAGERTRTGFVLGTEALTYLAAVTDLPPKTVRSLPLGAGSVSAIKQLVFYLAENAAGQHLHSLETGASIL